MTKNLNHFFFQRFSFILNTIVFFFFVGEHGERTREMFPSHSLSDRMQKNASPIHHHSTLLWPCTNVPCHRVFQSSICPIHPHHAPARTKAWSCVKLDILIIFRIHLSDSNESIASILRKPIFVPTKWKEPPEKPPPRVGTWLGSRSPDITLNHPKSQNPL